jgi:5-formyltetrahydrofolate cyclo-ligase
LGKGGGFSDVEFALASAAGLIGPDTVVSTAVHECQVMAAARIPTTEHDTSVDLIATPDRVRRPARRRGDARVRWEELTDGKILAIALLAHLRP